uniref:Major facilitator superfamily (MFS) profile domain-containing protein n=1 Tax=Bionectria ochroleuca TaxID=29856 RepID=A0A8H7N8P6_BIOOC
MGFRNRAPKSPEERMAENIRLVGRDIASALPENPRPWWKEPHLLRLNMLLLVVMMAAATVGYDGAMMNALQINLEWKSYYNNPAKAKLGAINAMMPAGKIIGFFFVAPFSNRFGRKKALCLAFIITVIGAVIQAVSINLGLLIFARFILGFGCGVMSQPSPILLAELAYPTQRGKITALYHCFYFIGAIAAAWITFGTLRMFLVAKGRDEEARALLVKYHAAGDENSSLVEHEMIQIRAAVRDQYNQEKRPPSKRWSLALPTWSGNTVVSYYLTLVLDGVGIKNATHQSLINGGLQIFNLLATVGCGAMLVDVLGRRRLFQWSAIGMTVSYIIWTILNSRFDATGSASFGYAVIPMLFIFYFHYDIALTPLLYSYPTELFPYEWRICNPIALAQLGWKYYILFCVLDAIFIVEVWFLFPETKGKSLEELADIFGRLDRKAPTDPGSNEVAMEETVKHEMDKGNIVHVDSR